MTEAKSDDLTAKFLQAVILSLRHDVVPAISTPSGRIHADLITRLLCMLHRRFAGKDDDLRNVIAQDRALSREMSSLTTGAKALHQPAARGFCSSTEALEAERMELELNLMADLPEMLKIVMKDKSLGGRARSLLNRMVDSQEAYLVAQYPDIVKGSAVCYQGGKLESDPQFPAPIDVGAEITSEILTAKIQDRFPGARIEGIANIAGGFSKSTTLFTLIQASGEQEALVMRKDLPVPFVSSVTFEYGLLQRLHGAGFPVAEPRWLETAPSPFAGAYLVSERVNGSTDVSRWMSKPQTVDVFAKRLAKTMADLHSLSLLGLGYAQELASKSAGELMEREIELWHAMLTQSRIEAHPMLEMTILWLKGNVPAKLYGRHSCLVHGDIGFHNLMIHEGHITALLDWEFAHPGDPLEDLLYTKPFIETVMPWTKFKSYYREFGGTDSSDEEEFFYSVWSKTRNQISAIRAARLFKEALPQNLKFASAGFILGRYFEAEAARLVLSVLN